jgi:predicted enzyme related to lactoylglutathione lyase
MSKLKARAGLVWYWSKPEKWEESLKFYRDTLGFTLVKTDDDWMEFEAVPGSHVALHKADENDDIGPSPNLGFYVEDLDSTIASLSARQVGLDGEPKEFTGVKKIAKILDPSGNRLHFYQELLLETL